MSALDQIHELLDRWEELRQQGQRLTAEELCKDTPHLTPEVAQRITALQQIDELLESSHTTAQWLEKPHQVAPEDWPDLPGYVILDQVGYGGTGVVYRAWQLSLGRTVAAKMLLGHPHPDDVRRLREEARILAQLQHAHILQIFDVAEYHGSLFFTMELAEQGSLIRKLRQGPQPPREAAALLVPLARAAHAAHQQQIVHRDVKPGNVLLMRDGTPKLGDFGLAKRLEEDGDTPSYAVFGTPAYMAPEQAEGKSKQAAPAVDIYSLGATLYALLTGQAPFRGDTKIEVVRKVLEEEAPAPRRLRPDVPRSLEAICCKCLEKRPERRYPSAEALAQDLENFLAGRPTLARPQRWPARTWRWACRHPLLWAVAVLALILAVAVPVVALVTDPDRPVRAWQQELTQGRTITLIGTENRLGWYRWPGPRGEFLAPRSGEGVALNGQAFSLLELLPDPGVDHFRFSAQVRHDESGFVGGETGLFFGCHELDTPDGKMLFFYSLSFNDLIDLTPKNAPPSIPTGNPVGLYPSCRPKTAMVPAGPSMKTGTTLHLFQPALSSVGGSGPWRELMVDVTPSHVRVYWEGHWVAKIPRDKISQTALDLMRQRWPRLNLSRDDLQPRGGMGVFVYKGQATFRLVRVEPL